MSNIDFASLSLQANEMLSAGATTETIPVSTSAAAPIVSPDVTPVQTPLTPPVEAVATPPVVEQSPTFDVDLGNGRIEKLTAAQVKDAYLNGLRQSDYTRKTQETATLKQQLEQATSNWQQTIQELQQLRQIAQDPRVKGVLGQPTQSTVAPQAVSFDPSAPMTLGQAQQMAQAIQERFSAIQSAPDPAKARQEVEQIVKDNLQVANWAESINATLHDVYKQYPVLKSHPRIEDMIRYEAARLEPNSIEAAQDNLKSIAKSFVEGIEKSFNARQTEKELVKAQLSTNGTEAPGGTAVPVQKPSFYKDGKMDWKGLASAAENFTG